jgi:hypothetical protein
MNRRTLVLLVAAIALGLAGGRSVLTLGFWHGAGAERHTSTLRSAPPARASQPSTRAGKGRLPPEFSILETRSIFFPRRAAVALPAGSDTGFVFKGVIQVGQGFTAFVEDVPHKRVIQVATGDPLANGRVKSIDIDTIEYSGAVDTRRITVGQNLEAVDVPVMPASRPAGKETPAADGPAAPPKRNGPRAKPPADAASTPAPAGPGDNEPS